MDIYSIAKADPKAEIRDRRTAKAKVFKIPGGKRHLCFGAPIHYWTSKGEGERIDYDEYDDIDIRLQHTAAEAEKTFGSYLASKNTFTYGFRDDGKAEKYIGIRRGADNQMEWSLLGVKLSSSDKTVPTTYTSAEKVTDFSFKHTTPDYEVITDFNEVHIRTAIKTAGAVSDFLIREQIDLKGITLLNKLDDSVKGNTEYVPINGEFQFETTDGHLLWLPTPKMWTDDVKALVPGSDKISHRLYEQDGNLIYEKYPTVEGKVWLATVTGPVFIDGDTYLGTTADNSVRYSEFGITWSNVYNASSGTLDIASSTYNALGGSYSSDYQYTLRRHFQFFDTSAIVGDVISCSFFGYGSSSTSATFVVMKSTIAGTTVAAADYNNFSGTYYSSGALTTSEAWKEFVFNALGISEVVTDGYTKLCIREYSHDYTHGNPTLGAYFQGIVYTANDSTYKPYLDIVEQTAPDAPTNVSATDGTHTDKVVVTWTKSTGATGYKVYEGSNLLDTLEDVETYDDTAAPAPTITPGSVVASDGSSTAHVALSLSGTSVANGATRTYKVVAVNAIGDSDDSSTNTGYRGHGTLTYQWQRSVGTVNEFSSPTNISNAESYNDTGAPAGSVPGTPTDLSASDGTYPDKVALSWTNVAGSIGAYRYYRCVLTATGCTQQIATANRGHRGAYTSTNTQIKRDATELTAIGSLATSYNDTGGAAPTITPGAAVASDGTVMGKVQLSISGESSNNGTSYSYYVRTYNAAGWGDWSKADNGYRGAGSLSYQWQRSATDDIGSSYSDISEGTTESYYDDEAPLDGTGRYFKCVLSAPNAVGATTTADRGYVLLPDPDTTGLDAMIQDLITSSSSMGAMISKTITAGIDIDAQLLQVPTTGTDMDALIEDIVTAAVSADAALQETKTLSLEVDAALALLGSETAEMDAHLTGRIEISAGVDALLQATASGSLGLDAKIMKVMSAIAGTDAVLMAEVINAVGMDSPLMEVITGTASMDAALSDTIGRQADIDGLLQAIVEEQASMNAALANVVSGAAELDAALAFASTALTSMDSMVEALAIVQSVGLHSYLMGVATGSLGMDAFMASSDYSVPCDNYIEAPGRVSDVSSPGRVADIEAPGRVADIHSAGRVTTIQ